MAASDTVERRAEQSEMGPFSWGGVGSLVFSAPHERAQMRDGVEKIAEEGTGRLAFGLAQACRMAAMATTGAQAGDPSWDEGNPYVEHLVGMARHGGVIDLHMMQPRGFEVCLGLGPDHELNRWLWQPLVDELLAADVRVSLNWPFGSRGRTVVAQAAARGVAGVQVEMAFEIFDEATDEHACVVTALARAAETWKARSVSS